MRLEITCQDRLGITQDVLDILTEYEIDLRGIEINEKGKIFLDFPSIKFEDFQHLMPKMRMIKGIDDVKTTPFMPIQRERNQLRALLRTLPDPCFSIDTNGKIILFNDAVSSGLEMSDEEILKLNIDEVITGFSFTKWLDRKEIYAQTQKIKFIEQDYIADILPVDVPDSDKSVLAGAVVMLKSETRLGKQMNVFNRMAKHGFGQFHAHSTAMKKMIKEAKSLAALDGHMLIYGETGTGKRKVAEACHESSHRAENNLVTVKLAGIPEDIIETDLFGTATHTGKLQQAQGGTLVFDELTEMPISVQRKLMRLLHGKVIEIDGHEQALDVRFVSLTSKDISELVEMGNFSEDLYYRLSVLTLVVPPLRERRADMVALSESIVRGHAKKLGIRAPKLSKSCVEYLQGYPWPGNIRQLDNALQRAIALIEGNEISKEAIQLPYCSATVSYVDDDFDGTLEQEVKRFEKDLLKRLYPSYPSTRQLAKKLGLSHTAIANKLREYGISKATVKY